MSNPRNITADVTSILVDQLGLEVEDISPEKNIITDLGADSLDRVELVMAFEEEFNIEIPDEAGEKFNTVADIVAYLEANVPA